MDTKRNVLCTGCLCAGRKMLIVDDYWKKKCFLQIVSEVPMTTSENTPVWLCWECDASIARFTKFKSKVVESLKLFQNYIEQNLDLTQIEKAPSLRTQKIIDIAIHPYTNDITEDIKIETDWDGDRNPEIDVKEESYNEYKIQNTISSDDEVLVEVAKKKRKSISSKKRRTEIYEEIVLNSSQIQDERLALANKEEYVNAMFRCERCIISFPNADDLKDHVKLKHELNASNCKCTICECSFASEVSYNYHMNRHTKRYMCLDCKQNFPSKGAVGRHHAQVHRSLDYNYDLSNFDGPLEEKAEGVNDKNSNTDSASFPCELCAKTFRWKTSLRKHLETHRIENGQKRKPYCEPCKLSFTTTSNLQKHVKTSSKHQIQLKLRKLKETLSQDGTTPEGQLATIERMKCTVNSERQKFPCTQCDRRFQWRGNLLRHMHSHAARAKGELICEPCNRTFSSIATYQQHMKISKKHVTENDFKYMCSECGKRFANKTRLQDHIDWEHLKNYVHTCPICQKVFKSHTSLYLHRQVVHEKDQAAHLCDHCGKAFPNQAKLRGHVVALHSREAPYNCGSCSAKFSWHSCLSRHVRRVHRRRDGAQN